MIYKNIIKLIVPFIVLICCCFFIKQAYLGFKSQIAFSDQYYSDVKILSEKDFCIKYYSEYRTAYLPVKCIKYFK
jgi:hypothetical protein